MDVDAIRSLYGYNRWANERLFVLVETLPPERARDRLGGSYDSIHDSFAHVLGGEILWLNRFRGVSPPTLLGGADFSDLGAIRARWGAQQRDMDAFLAGLTPTQLAGTIGYTSTSGERWAYPLWQMMVHLVNHGTHHRSELADMLTRAERPPPPMDLLIYYDELGAGRSGAEGQSQAT